MLPREGSYNLRAPSGEQLAGRYHFDGETGRLSCEPGGHGRDVEGSLGVVSWETIGPLPRGGGGASIGLCESEVITAIQQPWNADAFFVIPSRLDGTAEGRSADALSQYYDLSTPSARAQLAVHPALGQFLLDSAGEGAHGAADFVASCRGAGLPLRLREGLLELPEAGGEGPAEAFRSRLHLLRILVAEGVPACGATPDLSGLSKETHRVSLAFVTTLAPGPSSEALFRDCARSLLAAQYLGALRLAARRGRARVFLLPCGEEAAAGMSRALEMLGEEGAGLDIQALGGELAGALAPLGRLKPDLASGYGPDGARLPRFGAEPGQAEAEAEAEAPRPGVELEAAAWFRAESTRLEQEHRGARNVRAICEGVEQLWRWGLCESRRWTNDREACDPPGLPEEILDFPPEDQSLYVPSRRPEERLGADRPAPGDQVEVLQENDAGHFDAARVGTRGLLGRVLREEAQGCFVELRSEVLWYEASWLAPELGRPRSGDRVLVYTENAPGRFDARRRGTKGRVGVVAKDYGPGPSAYDVALPDGRTLQYDEDWVARLGEAPRAGDLARVMVENPTGHFDENRIGTRGRLGVVVHDDGSELPLLVQFKDGWSLFYAEAWLRKVPPERLRLFLTPVEGEALEEVHGDYALDSSQDSEGFPVWIKEGGSHLLHTDQRGRWAVTRAPENHIVALSRPHGGRYPQLVDQWGILRLGTFIPIDLRVQALSLAVLPGVRVRQKKQAACGGCCEAGPRERREETAPRHVWQREETEPSQRSHRRSLRTRHWERLVQFGPTSGPGCSGCCALFNETAHKTHCGRVFQGALDNAYLVEALNAISLRPKLARRLFLAWSVEFSVYAVRLFKNGTWLCVEVDDWVPVPAAEEAGDRPFCCHSEHFPDVLWPSVVEKAYAKACTIRDGGVGSGATSSGGWEAVGGGGSVDEALADLTGGVASSFSTRDVSPDRLFLYLYELQRRCLFVCRVSRANCRRNSMRLNPLAHHAVNRAAHHEGHCFVQVFCSHPSGVFSGGLDLLTIPETLVAAFPERVEDGFFWLSILDFHFYFDTIFECRLVNSPDVGIPLMPREAELRDFSEHVFATAGVVTAHRPPEFGVVVPEACEVVVAVEQTCGRILQLGPERRRPAALLLKVYEQVRGDAYSSEVVCRSAWRPARGAMAAFRGGGSFRIVAEVGYGERCDRLVFRCYTSASATVSAGAGLRRHLLVEPRGPPAAIPWTLVGMGSRARAFHPAAAEEDLDRLEEREREAASACCVA